MKLKTTSLVCSALRPFQQNSLQPNARLPRCHHPQRSARKAGMKIVALDAAQPYDFEHKVSKSLKQQKTLHIAIIGFGNFGQFLAKRLIAGGHQISASSKRDYSSQAKAMGATFYPDMDDLCEAHPDIVILATSMASTGDVVKALPVQRLRRSTLIVDVLSVKSFPRQMMLSSLPEEMDILCTHPMFGPDSGKGSWAGLNFMYEKVRIGRDPSRQRRVDAFLKFFKDEGCKMVEMSCKQHDILAAETQFTTHFVGRSLGRMGLNKTPIDTKGYEALQNLVENTNNDSFDLFYGLFLYNPNAVMILNRFEDAIKEVRQQLMTKLHEVAKEQLFEGMPDHESEQIQDPSNFLGNETDSLQKGLKESVSQNGSEASAKSI